MNLISKFDNDTTMLLRVHNYLDKKCYFRSGRKKREKN